ncbi:hypothetical protein, partial [Klebsiella michiganensis]|uniref:hypothetical protein n=1 Tax=Klebsiella michiganensis TaxID=1134687 RepID=UPI003F66C7C2
MLRRTKSACNPPGRPYHSTHVAVQQKHGKRFNPCKRRSTMLTAEQVLAAHKANVETLFGLTNKAFE